MQLIDHNFLHDFDRPATDNKRVSQRGQLGDDDLSQAELQAHADKMLWGRKRQK